ncbi:tRNA lysidine(34) synthetase TilS [Taklimakanibacter lacteus]|uniref:tRNA lysidine(34) synthetase TilS n=1 Tax=Taklimakanibacter lacteus TaxID=2268456 RepID=UPI000E674833
MPAAEAARPIDLETSKGLFETLSFHAHVALAVSGGGDSTALMWLAARWAAALTHPPKISVLTVDHGLRPQAALECRRVAQWAEALGLAAHILTWKGPRPESGIQAGARDMRYGLMRDWCRAHQATLLVTAHTLEDQAETVLMRLARGSGIRGLAAMRPDKTGDILLERPLLRTSRAALRATLAAAGHPWIEDPSNEDERFERVRWRKALAELGDLGLTPQTLARSAERLSRALLPLDELARDFLARHVDLRPEGFAMIERASFHKLDDEIGISVLERLLGHLGGGGEPPRLMAVEALHQWLRRGESQARTLAGCRIAQRQRQLLIGREPGRINASPVALVPGKSVLWDNRFRIAIAKGGRPCQIVPVKALKMARNPHIPAFVQESLPAILLDGEVAAVPGLGFLGERAPTGLQAQAEFHKLGP